VGWIFARVFDEGGEEQGIGPKAAGPLRNSRNSPFGESSAEPTKITNS
jgi:hypothetical protein